MALERSDLLSTEDYAKLTRRKPQSIRRERTRGGGPRYLRLGRRVFYRAADIEEWLESKLVSSTSQDPCPEGHLPHIGDAVQGDHNTAA